MPYALLIYQAKVGDFPHPRTGPRTGMGKSGVGFEESTKKRSFCSKQGELTDSFI